MPNQEWSAVIPYVVIMICLMAYGMYRRVRWTMNTAAAAAAAGAGGRLQGSHLVFTLADNHGLVSSTDGLDKAAIESLMPEFTYQRRHDDPEQCAVCLGKLEDGDTGRRIPRCGHSFHTECIDMWFHSHSTCPLCRCPVSMPPSTPPPPPPPPSSSSQSSQSSQSSSLSSSLSLSSAPSPSPTSQLPHSHDIDVHHHHGSSD